MTLLPYAFSFLWILIFWLLTRNKRSGILVTVLGGIACVIAVGLAAPTLWTAIQGGYQNDSFWTLDPTGRAGVIAISTIGLSLVFLLLAAKTKPILARKQQDTATAWLLIDLALGLFLFAVLYSVSPQIFYSFYRLIIPGLPQQWVIDGLLNFERLRAIATLAPNGSLSDHLAGVALWAVIPFTCWLHLRYWWRGGA